MKKTISIAFALFATIHFSFAASSTLDAQKQKQVIERVKEYCTLMKEFSGDVEKIDNMETIFGICENSNVSVFNDLTVPSARDISANSMPLQQYMMTLTDKFENNVKTSYSGYKYVKTIVQPSPLEGFDAASYAFVKVNKQVNTGSYKAKMNLNVIVNTETMKVSSTISEDYEDPQSIYLEALTKYNEGKYEEAIPLFDKVSGINRFSGRFRAKSMLGWIYVDKKEYQKAYILLREAADQDPLGGVLLASKILMRDDVPATLRNYTEGIRILQNIGDMRDKEIPIMHLIAKSAIFDAAIDLKYLNQKINLENIDLDGLYDSLINDSLSTDAFRARGYLGKGLAFSNADSTTDLKKKMEYLDIAKKHLDAAVIEQYNYENFDLMIGLSQMGIAQLLNDTDKISSLYSYLIEKPYLSSYIALVSLYDKNVNTEETMTWFKKAAETGDAFSCYIMSLSYIPFHNPLLEYEVAYIRDLVKSMDPLLYKGWVNFLGDLTSDSNVKSKEEFNKWNQKAIDLNDVNAMEDRAIFETHHDSPCDINIPHAIELACKAACIGFRSNAFKFFFVHAGAKNIEEQRNVPFDKSETYKTLLTLDEQGNAAASYLLYLDCQSQFNDTVRAMQYLEKSKDLNFYYAMHDYALIQLLELNDYDKSFDVLNKMTIYPHSQVYVYLGLIEENRHNYENAINMYQKGVKENDYRCYESLAYLYKNGIGVKKDLNEAKEYVEGAIAFYKVYYAIGSYENDKDYLRLKELETEINNLISSEGAHSTDNSYIAGLNKIIDNSISADARINKSQKLLKEIFASPKAVVKTVGSNGKTVVSTETAEDFLLRLATMPTDKKLVEVSSKKDKNGKYTELTVQMK